MPVIKIPAAAYISEWARKEYGSYEDHDYSQTHPHALLKNNAGKSAMLTEAECQALIASGQYHSTAWDDDEIEGGKRTKDSIKAFVNKLKELQK